MTKDELRRKYIVTSEDKVTQILRQAFDEDDRHEARYDEDGFNDHFFLEDCHEDDIYQAWNLYQRYHRELANYETVPFIDID